MYKNKIDHSGFTLVESLLILLVVAVIGFGGYYVWHTQHNNKVSTKIGSHLSKSSSKLPTSTNNTNSSTETNTLKIPELGIKIINIPPSINDLQYQMASQTGSLFVAQANFTTKTLTDKNQQCNIGSMFKASGIYDATNDFGPFTYIKQFNDFWVAYKLSGVPCSQDHAILNIQTNAMNEFGNTVKVSSNVVTIN